MLNLFIAFVHRGKKNINKFTKQRDKNSNVKIKLQTCLLVIKNNEILINFILIAIKKYRIIRHLCALFQNIGNEN